MRKNHAIARTVAFLLFSFLFLQTVHAQNATVKGTVKDSTLPLAGASVVIEGKGGTNTKADGTYEIKIAPGSYTITVSYVGYAKQVFSVTLSPKQVFVLNATLAKADALENFTVVGTRSAAIRSNTQTVAPVDVFSSKELMATGQVEPTQMLNYVAPSFNSSRQTISDGTDHIDPATLRGLGPDQVLVLVNGRRRYNTALVNVNGTIGRGSVGTDLNSIPASAIEKIEVLRDGAASQYGSDAIAGVINVVLKHSQKLSSLNAYLGQYYKGDGNTKALSAAQGFKLGKKGYVDFFGDLRWRQGTNRAGDYTGTVYTSNVALDNQLIAQRGFNRSNNILAGNSDINNFGIQMNSGIPLSERVNLNISGGMNWRDGRAAGFYRYPKQTTQVIAALYPDGFLPYITSDIKDQNITASVDGITKSGIRWDIGSTYGGNSFAFGVENSNNATQYLQGANAQTSFYAGKISFYQNTNNINIAKDFGKSMGLNSFNVAIGGEYRTDFYKILPGEEASYANYAPGTTIAPGAQVFPGFQPTNAIDEKRNVSAGYLDVETDLTKNLLVNAAGRYEHYSDFGGKIAGKLSARYKIFDALSIRGTVSNGFRAPSIHQQYFNNTSTQFVSNGTALVPTQVGIFRNESDLAKAFGIPKLGAEKSMNYSIGLTSKIGKSISVTLDGYMIDIKDRIVLSGDFNKSNASVAPILAPYPDISIARFFTNAIDTKTKGLDLVINSTHNLGTGIVTFTFSGNLNKTEVTNIKSASKIPNDANILFNRQEITRLEYGQPRSKAGLGMNYVTGPFTINVRSTRFGVVRSSNISNPLLDESFNAKVVTDASFTYSLLKFINLTIGAQNIGNVYPDQLMNVGNTSEGRFIYSRETTQFGFNGGYWYSSVGFDFTKVPKKALKPLPVVPPPPPPVVEKPKDTDGDGTPDKNDECPTLAGPASLKGCPDADKDGIADKNDKCPTVAGIAKFGGCPDTDGDGIEDAKDKCPNQPGVEKYAGCPVPDTDGDGLNDDYDKCPTVPGTIANDGCPDNKEKQDKVDKSAKRILFISGSATLAKSSGPALKEVSDVLKENAALSLDIEGHTDDTGADALNMKLSEKRAGAIKTYLAKLGVDPSRINVQGFGETQPIADNKTAAGRKLNRRVVLKLKN